MWGVWERGRGRISAPTLCTLDGDFEDFLMLSSVEIKSALALQTKIPCEILLQPSHWLYDKNALLLSDPKRG